MTKYIFVTGGVVSGFSRDYGCVQPLCGSRRETSKITAILYQIVGQAAFRRKGRDVNLKTYAMSIIKTNSRHTVLCPKSVLW